MQRIYIVALFNSCHISIDYNRVSSKDRFQQLHGRTVHMLLGLQKIEWAAQPNQSREVARDIHRAKLTNFPIIPEIAHAAGECYEIDKCLLLNFGND